TGGGNDGALQGSPVGGRPAEKVRKATIRLRDPKSARQCTAYPPIYPAASRCRRTCPHEANGTSADTRAGGPSRSTRARSEITSAPAISGPTAATRNADLHPARGATAP